MIKENQRLFNLLLVLGDAVISIFSMLLSYHIRFNLLAGESNAIELVYYMQLMLVAVPAYFLIYHYFGLHETYRHKALTSEIGKVMEANLVGIIFIFVLAFFLKEVNISRMVILLFGGINFILSSIERIILRKLLRYLRRKGYNLKHLLLVGWNEACWRILRQDQHQQEFRLQDRWIYQRSEGRCGRKGHPLQRGFFSVTGSARRQWN